jgi:hypothetical protein
VRALFREFSPVGSPPVTVSGINYELIKQLEPAGGQIISLAPVVPSDVISSSIQVGSQIGLETGVILDRKGNSVPDGTPVEFQLVYPAENLNLAPRLETTTGGRARTTITLDRPGDLWVTVRTGEAKDSTRIELKVGGDTPGSIATVMPTPTETPAPTLTPDPTSTPTREPEPSPTPAPAPLADPPAPAPRVGLAAFRRPPNPPRPSRGSGWQPFCLRLQARPRRAGRPLPCAGAPPHPWQGCGRRP